MVKRLLFNRISVLTNLLVLGLRISTMGIKYICTMLSFYFLKPADYIDFGIVLAAVNLFVLVIGVDLYQASQRHHTNANKEQSTNLFISEVSLGLVVLFGLSTVYYLCFSNIHQYFIQIALIIYCDYVILTSSRLILAKASAVLSSFITSLRVLPLLLVCIYLAVDQANAAFERLITIWCMSSIMVAILTIIFLFKKWLILSKKIKVAFKLRDFKTSLLFWLSSVSTYFLLFIDKVLVNKFSSVGFASSYIFFASMFSLLPAFVDAGIVLPNFKSMLNDISYERFKVMFKQAILGCSLLILVSVSCLYFAKQYDFLEQEVYLLALIIPIIVNCFLGLNYVPSLFLYASKADKEAFLAHLAQLSFLLVLTVLAFIFDSIELFLIGYSTCYAILLYIKLMKSKKLHALSYSISK